MTCCGTEKRDGDAPRRAVDVEFLYLDRTACARCRGTEEALRAAVEEARRILEPSGVDVSLRRIHVRTEQQARALGFVSSPTVRLNGRDATPDVRENVCPDCGDISCRVWTWQGKEYEAYGRPAAERAAPAPPAGLPGNLRRFFAR